MGDDGCMDSGFNVLMLPLACWLELYPSKSPSILPAIVDLYVICATDWLIVLVGDCGGALGV